MTTDLRKEFEEFIQDEMPDLLSDDKKKELQECWIAYIRGHMLRLDMEIRRGGHLLLRHEQKAKQITIVLEFVFFVLLLTLFLGLIFQEYK